MKKSSYNKTKQELTTYQKMKQKAQNDITFIDYDQLPQEAREALYKSIEKRNEKSIKNKLDHLFSGDFIPYQVFISYRREGGEDFARSVYQELEKRGYKVFFDVESLRSGKFNEKLLSVIDECKDIIVILPPNGLDRCSDPKDWVYREVSYAIRKGKNIIPIMLKGFHFPDSMPEGIQQLRSYNGITSSQELFSEVMLKLRKTRLTCVPQRRIRRIVLAALLLALASAVVLIILHGNNKNEINQHGYGPYDRKLFSLQSPADYVTFNSIVDNNGEIGDERYFVSASSYTGDASKNHWTDYTTVEEGQEYVVRIYVDNNAAPSLGLAAKDARVYVILPQDAGTELHVFGKIYAANANPDTVWDSTGFYSKDGRNFLLRYVTGSAKYYTINDSGELITHDLEMDPSIQELHLFQTEGVAIGNNALNGEIFGGISSSGYLTFHLIAEYQ